MNNRPGVSAQGGGRARFGLSKDSAMQDAGRSALLKGWHGQRGAREP